MSTSQAKRQFEENLQLFGDPNNDPEKYNLYAGLVNLTKAIEQMEYEISLMKSELQIIKSRLG